MIRALALAAALAGALPAHAACRQALALGVDVSGSVDSREYRLQLDGIAAALTAPDVRGVLMGMPEAPVALAVYEWSSADFQRVLVDWTVIRDAAALDAIAARLRATKRMPRAPYSTAIGAALRFGAALLARAPDCWQATLDISGDGENNDGPAPEIGRALPGEFTVNGLVIGSDSTSGVHARIIRPEWLADYFRAHVLRGPGAFVVPTMGFQTYAEAMEEKLLRELTGLQMSEARR